MYQEDLCSEEFSGENILIDQSDFYEKDYKNFDYSYTPRETQNSNNNFDNNTNNLNESQQSSQNLLFFSSNDINNLDENNNNNLEIQNENFIINKENDINMRDDFYNNNLNLIEDQQLSQNLFVIPSNEKNNLNNLENPKEKININYENNNNINNINNEENQISKKKCRKKKGDLKEGKTHDKSENGNMNKKIINRIHNCIIEYSNKIIKDEFEIQIRKFEKINSNFMKNISTKQKNKDFLDLKIKDFLNNNITTKFKNKSNNKNEETLNFFLENKNEKYKNNHKLNYYLEMKIETFYKEKFLKSEYKKFIESEESKLKEKNENNEKYIQKLKKMTENFIEDNYYLSKRKNNSLFITNNDK